MTDAMWRHADHEPARSRIRSHQRLSQPSPARIAQGIIHALGMTPKFRQAEWSPAAGPGPLARIDLGDLTEALGALLENALRHARRRITPRS